MKREIHPSETGALGMDSEKNIDGLWSQNAPRVKVNGNMAAGPEVIAAALDDSPGSMWPYWKTRKQTQQHMRDIPSPDEDELKSYALATEERIKGEQEERDEMPDTVSCPYCDNGTVTETYLVVEGNLLPTLGGGRPNSPTLESETRTYRSDQVGVCCVGGGDCRVFRGHERPHALLAGDLREAGKNRIPPLKRVLGAEWEVGCRVLPTGQ